LFIGSLLDWFLSESQWTLVSAFSHQEAPFQLKYLCIQTATPFPLYIQAGNHSTLYAVGTLSRNAGQRKNEIMWSVSFFRCPFSL
jgi:hypothetical protein